MFHAKDLAFFSAFHFSMRWTQAKLQALGELLECLFTFWYNYTYYFRTRENKFLVIYWLNGCKLIDLQSPNKNVKKMFGRCMNCLYWRKLGCSKLFAPFKIIRTESLKLEPNKHTILRLVNPLVQILRSKRNIINRGSNESIRWMLWSTPVSCFPIGIR